MDTTTLRVNGVCNAGCSFCALSGIGREDLARAFERLKQDVADGAKSLRLGGGEPMLLPDLVQVIRDAKQLGFTDIILETNATVASLPGRVEPLVQAGLTQVMWSLNSGDSTLNSSVYGFANAHESSLAGIAKFIDASVEVIVRTPLSAQNIATLAEVPEWLRGTLPSISTWWLRPLKRASDAPFSTKELPTLKQLSDVLPTTLLNARRWKIDVRIEDELGLPFCTLRKTPGLLSHLDRRAKTERETSHVHGAACAECAVATDCPGQPIGYVQAHGLFEVIPFDKAIPALSQAASRPERIITYHRTGHGDRPAPGPQVTIRIIMPCNQACTFCFVDRTSASPPPATVFQALEDAAEAGADRVSFSGGEPTLHPRLADYVQRAKELEIPGVEIQTNALRLTDASLCDTLVDAGVNKAVVSLHAVDPEAYTAITGAGTPEEVLTGTRNLLDRGVSVEVNVVHCDANLTHLGEIIRTIAERIPEAVVLLSVTYIVAGIKREWESVAIRYTDAVPHLAEALREAKKHSLNVRLTGRCSVPPCAWSDRLEDLKELNLAHSHTEDAEDGHVYFESCDTCAAKTTCYGISKDYIKAFGQDEFKPISAKEWQRVKA
jgi:molybdenum cofactor biosynthesis enzyme MoaA